MKIKVNGKRYFVEIHQKNETLPNLILLHGFMGSGRAFSSLVEGCKPFCNPVAIDLLGHGKTAGASTPERFRVEHQIDDLAQLISQISKEKPVLYGYSMGGRLMLRYALAYPQKLNGIILESVNDGLSDEEKINQRKITDEKRAVAIEHDFVNFVNEWQMLPLFKKGTYPLKSTIYKYKAMQLNQRPKQMANSLRGFGTAQMKSVKDRLKNVNTPVLIIVGQADSKYVQIAHEMHHEIPESTLHIVANAGHRVHLERPKEVISEVKSFVKVL